MNIVLTLAILAIASCQTNISGSKDRETGYLINSVEKFESQSLEKRSLWKLFSVASLNDRLFEAVRNEHIENVRKYLREGASANIINVAGETPLHEAAKTGNTEIVRILLANGARTNIKSHYGSYPADIAKATKHFTLVPLLSDNQKYYGKFMQLSDIHLDLLYKLNASATIDQLCHSGKGNALPFGHHVCDSPISLVASSFLQMIPLANDLDFVVVTGDFVRHDHDLNFERSESEILTANKMIVNYYEKVFKDKPVVISLGNNDYPPSWTSEESSVNFEPLVPIYQKFIERPPIIESREVIKHIDASWRLAQLPLETFRIYGYYAQRMTNVLTVISLNTQYFFEPQNFRNDRGTKHLEWLTDILKELEMLTIRSKNSQKALIIGHVPPHSEMYGDYLKSFLGIMKRFSKIIIGSIYGHTNVDYFRVIYQDSDKPFISSSEPAAVAFSSIGLVPGPNPSFRIYEYDASQLLDYHMFTADLDKTNEKGIPEFKRTYSFREAYQVKGLDAVSVAKVVKSFTWDLKMKNDFLDRCVAYQREMLQDFDNDNWHRIFKKICDGQKKCKHLLKS